MNLFINWLRSNKLLITNRNGLDVPSLFFPLSSLLVRVPFPC